MTPPSPMCAPRLSRRSFLGPLLGVPLWPLAALAQAPGAVGRPLRVVASFSILADLVREVGGGGVDVVPLVGPDADAHVFEPRPADARRLANAELVVVNGLGFEGWLDRLVRSSGYRGPVVVASRGVSARLRGLGPDPHAWQDLANAKLYVQNIRDAMCLARPASAPEFGRRAAAYLQRLDGMDRETKALFGAMPASQRRLISSHDAFGYFAVAYGVEFLFAQGISTESDASASGVAMLIDQIRHQAVRAVFLENISDPRLVERIAREGGVAVGGRLYSDALSAPGGVADTYLKLFAHNVATIEAGLQGPRAGAR